MLKILNRRYPLAKVLIWPAQVQGDGAATTIVRGIEELNQLSSDTPDTIVLARGGGSIEDLWPFNEESVARAVFASRIPIVSAIGHETDFTICDFVADLRAATPTHAAELITPNRDELLRELVHITKRLSVSVGQEVELQAQRLRRCRQSTVLRFPEKIVVDARQTVDRVADRLQRFVDRTMQDKQMRLLRPSERLTTLNPMRVLERGFALAELANGKVITDSAQLAVGEKLNVHFRSGAANCCVESLQHPPRGKA
jgi:exodeoxyribonuclease VII large subunit